MEGGLKKGSEHEGFMSSPSNQVNYKHICFGLPRCRCQNTCGRTPKLRHAANVKLFPTTPRNTTRMRQKGTVSRLMRTTRLENLGKSVLLCFKKDKRRECTEGAMGNRVLLNSPCSSFSCIRREGLYEPQRSIIFGNGS